MFNRNLFRIFFKTDELTYIESVDRIIELHLIFCEYFNQFDWHISLREKFNMFDPELNKIMLKRMMSNANYRNYIKTKAEEKVKLSTSFHYYADEKGDNSSIFSYNIAKYSPLDDYSTIIIKNYDYFIGLQEYGNLIKFIYFVIDKIQPFYIEVFNVKLFQLIDTKTTNFFHGWMTFICEYDSEIIPEDIQYEKLTNGGILIFTTKEKFSMENPEHLAHSLRINEFLRENGIRKNYFAEKYNKPIL